MAIPGFYIGESMISISQPPPSEPRIEEVHLNADAYDEAVRLIPSLRHGNVRDAASGRTIPIALDSAVPFGWVLIAWSDGAREVHDLEVFFEAIGIHAVDRILAKARHSRAHADRPA